jgi:beta-propeller repeat-containing protein
VLDVAAQVGVAVGSDGSVYVAGSVRLGFNQQIFITKFASNGTVLWHKVWNTPESGGETQGQDVAIDAAGNIYVAGVTPRPDPNQPGGIIGFDVALLKVDSAGNLIWQRTVAAGETIDSRGGVAVAPDGSVYVAGGRFDQRTSDLNALVLKFGSDGSLLWNRNWGGRSGDDAAGVIVRADGAILVSGNTNSFGSGSDDAFLLRLEPNGRVTDAMTWGGPLVDHGDSIAINSGGNVVIGGTAEGPPYSFLGAPMRVSKDRAALGTPNFPLISVESGVTDAAGVVEPIAGTTNDDPGFDAALLVIAP